MKTQRLVDTYPFIPYQFKLLQDVFTDIRKHGYAGALIKWEKDHY